MSQPDDRWTREEWIAGARAEIEREGIHVEISDDVLWEAMTSPLREQMRRYRQVEARLGKSAAQTAAALHRFVEAIEEQPQMYWCPRDYCGWTGSRRPTGGACPECLLGNDERVMVIEG